uniref:Antifreeze protein n=1 Tax=Romanomermis culicivorax TaxID=13658 RepID=A0A915K9N5_ROMCU
MAIVEPVDNTTTTTTETVENATTTTTIITATSKHVDGNDTCTTIKKAIMGAGDTNSTVVANGASVD